MEEQRVLGAAAGFDGAEQTLRKGGEWLRAEVATAGLLGRDWGVDDLQVIMASYFGFISRWEPDGVVLEWMS